MISTPLARKIRTRKLGILIFDARTSARKTIDECALALGIPRESYLAYEQGEAAPSLPELEILAVFLGIPLDRFWSNTAISDNHLNTSLPPAEEVIPQRQQVIAKILRETRDQAGLSLEELAGQVGLEPSALQAYENGESAISVPDLEGLAPVIGADLEAFLDEDGLIRQMRTQEDLILRLRALPEDLQDFLGKPINRPYIDLAKRLSELQVERLRAIAEGILEITY